MTALPDEQARTLAGYKAALHNPRVSEGAKDHAAQVLREAGVEEAGGGLAHHHHGTHPHMDHEEAAKHEHHVVGGYKSSAVSTLSNPRTSEQAKEHAAHMLEQVGSGQPLPSAADSPEAQLGEHERHVLGGYKSTVNNPGMSEDTRRYAAGVLASHDKATSTLQNDDASAEAKENAKQIMAEFGF